MEQALEPYLYTMDRDESDQLLKHRLTEELQKEYYRSLLTQCEEQDPQLTWADVHVWFHNLNHQHVLPEVKKVWDAVLASPLGKKSL